MVNDGSTDDSLAQIPSSDRIILISYPENMGKGHALRKGLEESINRGFAFAFTIDADLQHPPEYIPEFLSLKEKYDIIIGNRLNDLSSMPIQRIASNKITSFLLSKKTGKNILDSQSGYRLFHTDVLTNILPERNGFEAESEMLIYAARNNLKIGFTPIPTIYGTGKSKIKPVKTIIDFIKILFM